MQKFSSMSEAVKFALKIAAENSGEDHLLWEDITMHISEGIMTVELILYRNIRRII